VGGNQDDDDDNDDMERTQASIWCCMVHSVDKLRVNARKDNSSDHNCRVLQCCTHMYVNTQLIQRTEDIQPVSTVTRVIASTSPFPLPFSDSEIGGNGLVTFFYISDIYST